MKIKQKVILKKVKNKKKATKKTIFKEAKLKRK